MGSNPTEGTQHRKASHMSNTALMGMICIALAAFIMNIITILMKLTAHETIKTPIILAVVNFMIMVYFIMRAMPN